MREFLEDGRKPIDSLFERFDSLCDVYGFEKVDLWQENVILSEKKIRQYPISVFKSKNLGPAFWILAGVHGEEPAGPNAIFEQIDLLGNLSKSGVPMVIIPMCNPKGYFLNWRYPDQEKYSNESVGKSVGDSEHWLLDDYYNPKKPRSIVPSCQQAKILTQNVIDLCRIYPPYLSLDLHEDNLLDAGYIYSQGQAGQDDPVAKLIVEVFDNNNYPLHKTGVTRFGQKIRDGIVEKDFDGSIDELLAARQIFVEGILSPGPSAKSVIVIETSAHNRPLRERVIMQSKILEKVDSLWKIALS